MLSSWRRPAAGDTAVKFEAFATRTEVISGLWVQARTLGLHHVIDLPGAVVTITVPTISEKSVELRSSLARAPNDPDHTWFEVTSVHLTIDLKEEVEFEGSEADFNSMAVITSKASDRAFTTLKNASYDALELWKRTLRWIALAPQIGSGDIPSPLDLHHAQGFKVFRKSDGALFRGHGGTFFARGGGRVTRKAWDVAAIALTTGRRPPLWVDYMIEAHRRRAASDHRAAIVNAAIACETLIRRAFAVTLPPITSTIALSILEATPVQRLLQKWEAISGWSAAAAKSAGKSEVHELLNLRNAVMHQGVDDPHELGRIDKLLPKVTKFILRGNDHLAGPAGSLVQPAEGVLERLTGAKPVRGAQ